MRVCHYAGMEDMLQGGIKTSIRHQREALDIADIPYTTDPSDDHDVLHLNMVDPQSQYHLKRARRNDTPVVYHAHAPFRDFAGSFRFSTYLAPFVRWYTKRLYRKADLLLPVSESTDRLLRDEGIEVETQVVTNGIDPDRLDGFEQFADRRSKYDAEQPVVVNLGLVFPRKGIEDFVAAGEAFPDTDFIWFGPMNNRFLRAPAVTRNVKHAPDNVHFPGFVDEAREAFGVADIFFFPSHEENQPIAVLEAMYCGMPLVLRDIAAFDWLEHGTHCLKGSDSEELQAQLQRLVEDPELRERLGTNAKDLAAEHTLDAVADDLEQAYDTVQR